MARQFPVIAQLLGRSKRLAVFVVFLSLLVGCSNNPMVEKHAVYRDAPWLISRDTAIFLNQPKAMDTRSTQWRRTLTRFSDELDLSLRQVFPYFNSSETNLTLSDSFSRARRSGSKLVFIPKLIHSENHLNSFQELSEGKSLHPEKDIWPDKVAFQVLIYEVRTEKLLDVATIYSRSRFFASDRDQALDLFEPALSELVFRLTGKFAG